MTAVLPALHRPPFTVRIKYKSSAERPKNQVEEWRDFCLWPVDLAACRLGIDSQLHTRSPFRRSPYGSSKVNLTNL
jgi:hypothetical protein